MNKYDVCVFDLDGTLINSLSDLANCCNEALDLHSLPIHPCKAYKQFVGSGIKNLIKRAMGERAADEELFTSVYKAFNMLYEEKCLESTLPYEGITELLKKLKNSGVKLSVLSNKSDEFTRHITDSLFEKDTFDIVCGKKEGFPIKPAPDSLNATLSELNCTSDRCLYIGDSDVDVITASNANVSFCGVEWGFRGAEELRNAGAEIIVKKPKEIIKLVCTNE